MLESLYFCSKNKRQMQLTGTQTLSNSWLSPYGVKVFKIFDLEAFMAFQS